MRLRFHRSGPSRTISASLALWLALGLLVLGAVLWMTSRSFTTRFTETARIDAAVQSTLYSGTIAAALDRQSVVPLILAGDDALILALRSRDYTSTSQRLISILDQIEAANVSLLDTDGVTVAATDRRQIGGRHSDKPYFTKALRHPGTAFTLISLPDSQPGFYFSRQITSGNEVVGILVVQADLQKIEQRWRRLSKQVFVSDSEDNIILSSNPLWKNTNIQDFLARNSSRAPGDGILNFTFPGRDQAFTYIDGAALLRVDTKVGFQGWKLSYFETLEDVRARVNGILALEIMAFAILAAFAFFLNSRASMRASVAARRESDALRQLNLRLQAEIAQRQRAQKDLRVAEQSLAQHSKLAALGQMSAAVSHELNQPLAAMRTYMAGARLLMKRNRMTEAESSFQRIEDLLDRMGALTRQLKSFARKTDEDLGPVDLRLALRGALSMMAPQFEERYVRITRTLPETEALVHADQLRLEQIIVNLLRNALDAMKGRSEPHLDILLTLGDTVTLAIRDNGHGIEDVDQLFEPFFTTKKPGEGIGLGLAISAGIASDLGGRLTARSAEPRGAIFELQLPRISEPVAEIPNREVRA